MASPTARSIAGIAIRAGREFPTVAVTDSATASGSAAVSGSATGSGSVAVSEPVPVTASGSAAMTDSGSAAMTDSGFVAMTDSGFVAVPVLVAAQPPSTPTSTHHFDTHVTRGS
jgi:hypothetical protein